MENNIDNVQIISAVSVPNTELIQLSTYASYGFIVLLLCAIVFIVLIGLFIKQLKTDNPTIWLSIGSPTLLKNNFALLSLLFGKNNKEIPHTLSKKAKIIRYLAYFILLLIIVLMIVTHKLAS
ncbi:MAG: hypothetical protein KGV56_03770 [Gammaproteobacteria bacterium]|nr:hypothetical protein [Gammaproteobacteria bacterium]